MSKMLQTLTLSYPDRPTQCGPRVQVLFTNLSRFKYDDDEEEDAESFASESDEEAHPQNKKPEEEKKESKDTEVNLDNLII
jgi:hypothetical protein